MTTLSGEEPSIPTTRRAQVTRPRLALTIATGASGMTSGGPTVINSSALPLGGSGRCS